MATTPIINAQLDSINGTLKNLAAANTMIAGKLGAMSAPTNWGGYQAIVRAGLAEMYTIPGDQLEVEMSSMVTAAVDGTGIRSASVDASTFIAAAGTEKFDYVFSYDGTNWNYDGSAVSLTTYGITFTGTPAVGDLITVHRTASTYAFNVLGLDEDEPVNENIPHVVSIQIDNILSRIRFDIPQFLYVVNAAEWPNGLPAGNYKITLNHGAYDGNTAQDGTYRFTTTQVVPVGGGIRHTTIGRYNSDGVYNASQITDGTFVTYGSDTITVIESEIATATGTTGTSLGTTTASDPQYKTGNYINYTRRQYYGSSRYKDSYLFQLLNSDDEVVQWEPKSEWSRNSESHPEGFLHSIDQELRGAICKVRKRLVVPDVDGGGYEDVEAYCFPATRLDVFGTKTSGVSEGPVDAEGNVTRTGAYTYWKDNNTNEDRIKYLSNVARIWYLSSSSGISSIYAVGNDGTSQTYTLGAQYGVVPCLFVG